MYREFDNDETKVKTYLVNSVYNKNISIEDLDSRHILALANVETRFVQPWNKTDVPYTEFRAICNKKNFYFDFRVDDNDLIIKDKCHNKMDIIQEDRVELFFALDDQLNNYYCLEIDPRGRVFSCAASYYRKFDLSWECPGLHTVGCINKSGYTVKGLIPLETLKSLGLFFLEKGDSIKVGIFRADFYRGVNNRIEERWISWINPKTENPDFHVPAAFGLFHRK
ncbi:MAG: carbohydrate-binding family 9-like protein [Calditrichia bacterium]|nr:carbohydrate-binding family 9-like protein [Calditrichia bacterium]